MEVEEYFPRGGKKPTTSHFKQNSNFLGAPEKSDKKKKKSKKKPETDDGYLSDETTKTFHQSYSNCAIGIHYKTAKQDTLLLGRISKIQETKITVMMPSRITGYVMACHISEPYNKQLEAYVNDKIDKVKELSQMFKPGQYVALKVLEESESNLMLSMMPHHVNGARQHNDMHNGALIQAAVSSIEDHGYVMDIGIASTIAFLPASKTNPDIELDVGMLTWCCIKSITPGTEKSVVELTNALPALQRAYQRRSTGTIITPGSAVDFTVNKEMSNGIEGRVFEDTTAYIQRYHADSVKGKKPALGQKIRARVLYVMPTRNTPFLTMKNIFETTYPDLDEEQKLQHGDIVEEAQVLKISGRSIHFKLGSGIYGAMSIKRINVDENLTDQEVLAKSYPIGSVHKVRVLCYNLCDYMYSVSDEPSVLKEKYFNVSQLSPGDMVSATVKSIESNRINVHIGRLFGFVPLTHLSDAGVYIDPKQASENKILKKFKVGQELKARVLVVDEAKPNLILTLKPTLLSPTLEILKSYENVDVGKCYTGVIKYIRDFVLVTFFNNVIAYVPRTYVTKEQVDNLNEIFHLGQIVNCTILRVDPKSKKMTGSLTTGPFQQEKKREKGDKRKHTNDINHETPMKKPKHDPQSNEDISEKEIKKKKNSKIAENANMDNEDTDSEKKDKKSKAKENSSKKNKTAENKVEEFTNSTDTDIEETRINKDTGTETKKKKTKDKSSKKKKSSELVESSVDIFKNCADIEQTTNKPKKKTRNSMMEDESEIYRVSHKKKEVEDEQKNRVSEESDAIETDINEDSDQILTPRDLGLLDFSDCSTAKKYKKRIVSLLKSIKARTLRADVIQKKITRIENKGLDAENKKFHTAMHTEKLVIEQRVNKLLEALALAQKNLKEYGLDDSNDYKKKKTKRGESSTDGNEGSERGVRKKRKEISVVENFEPVLEEVPSVKDFWKADAVHTPQPVEEEESSSSEDEDRDQPKKKRKKLSVAEKLAKVREEEERVREMERKAIESESAPRSSEQFERALLANPASSQLWIAYMAFHLQATELEKARAVCRKALNTIPFREEQEKLNVWLALLNCENRFGTKETQQKTLEEALQMNDRFQIHSKLLDIYVETSKHQELSSLVDLMLRKYKHQQATYTMCGSACFKLGLVEKARQVMQKAMVVLEKKEHVAVLVQFALMERSLGDRERAEALFEQILAVYPHRVDVIITYVDMLLKGGDLEHIRQVLDRMTSQQLPARKMKILYKKWVEVEEKVGTPEQVDKIRQRAVDYVEKAKF